MLLCQENILLLKSQQENTENRLPLRQTAFLGNKFRQYFCLWSLQLPQIFCILPWVPFCISWSLNCSCFSNKLTTQIQCALYSSVFFQNVAFWKKCEYMNAHPICLENFDWFSNLLKISIFIQIQLWNVPEGYFIVYNLKHRYNIINN